MVQDNNKTIHVDAPQTYVSPRIRTVGLKLNSQILAASVRGVTTSNFGNGSWDNNGGSINAAGFEAGNTNPWQ